MTKQADNRLQDLTRPLPDREARPLVEAGPTRSGESSGGLRLDTLVRLRWLAVIGQSVAILVVHFLFEFALPLVPAMALIVLSAWLNIFLTVRWRSSLRLSAKFAFMLLAFDTVQLGALVFLTGGLENPFSFLLLVPVMVSATALPVRHTVLLGMLAILLVSFLAFWHLPLPWRAGEPFDFPVLYLAGVWSAIVCAMLFASVYANRVSREARDMSDALAATELVLAQEQRLSALDGLAAAAAHELGTPLATIALIARELQHDRSDPKAVTEDLELLSSQTARCREILAKLANHDGLSADLVTRLSISVFMDELIESIRTDGRNVVLDCSALDGGGPEPVVTRHPAIRFGLANLLDNAIDYAASKVIVDVRWNYREIMVTITDDGPGFSLDVIDRLGDPYVTTRKGYTNRKTDRIEGEHEGMGLGFFIAKTLLTRSGASVLLANRASPATGAIVRIAWPRSQIEATDGGWAF